MRAGRAGNYSEFYFRLADLGAGNGDAIVAGHRDFEAAAESCAVNGDDDWLVAVFDFQKKWEQACAARFSGSHFAEFFDIGAGNEGAAAADEDDGFDGGILRNLIEGVGNALGDAGAERVDRGIIYGDYGDAVFFCELDEVGHGKNPCVANLRRSRGEGAGV